MFPPPETDAPRPDASAGDDDPGARPFSQQFERCPGCHVGNFVPITYDPDSTHERRQAEEGARFESVNGSEILRCFNCGYQQSRALVPPDKAAGA